MHYASLQVRRMHLNLCLSLRSHYNFIHSSRFSLINTIKHNQRLQKWDKKISKLRSNDALEGKGPQDEAMPANAVRVHRFICSCMSRVYVCASPCTPLPLLMMFSCIHSCIYVHTNSHSHAYEHTHTHTTGQNIRNGKA